MLTKSPYHSIHEQLYQKDWKQIVTEFNLRDDSEYKVEWLASTGYGCVLAIGLVKGPGSLAVKEDERNVLVFKIVRDTALENGEEKEKEKGKERGKGKGKGEDTTMSDFALQLFKEVYFQKFLYFVSPRGVPQVLGVQRFATLPLPFTATASKHCKFLGVQIPPPSSPFSGGLPYWLIGIADASEGTIARFTRDLGQKVAFQEFYVMNFQIVYHLALYEEVIGLQHRDLRPSKILVDARRFWSNRIAKHWLLSSGGTSTENGEKKKESGEEREKDLRGGAEATTSKFFPETFTLGSRTWNIPGKYSFLLSDFGEASINVPGLQVAPSAERQRKRLDTSYYASPLMALIVPEVWTRIQCIDAWGLGIINIGLFLGDFDWPTTVMGVAMAYATPTEKKELVDQPHGLQFAFYVLVASLFDRSVLSSPHKLRRLLNPLTVIPSSVGAEDIRRETSEFFFGDAFKQQVVTFLSKSEVKSYIHSKVLPILKNQKLVPFLTLSFVRLLCTWNPNGENLTYPRLLNNPMFATAFPPAKVQNQTLTSSPVSSSASSIEATKTEGKEGAVKEEGTKQQAEHFAKVLEDAKAEAFKMIQTGVETTTATTTPGRSPSIQEISEAFKPPPSIPVVTSSSPISITPSSSVSRSETGSGSGEGTAKERKRERERERDKHIADTFAEIDRMPSMKASWEKIKSLSKENMEAEAKRKITQERIRVVSRSKTIPALASKTGEEGVRFEFKKLKKLSEMKVEPLLEVEVAQQWADAFNSFWLAYLQIYEEDVLPRLHGEEKTFNKGDQSRSVERLNGYLSELYQWMLIQVPRHADMRERWKVIAYDPSVKLEWNENIFSPRIAVGEISILDESLSKSDPSKLVEWLLQANLVKNKGWTHFVFAFDSPSLPVWAALQGKKTEGKVGNVVWKVFDKDQKLWHCDEIKGAETEGAGFSLSESLLDETTVIGLFYVVHRHEWPLTTSDYLRTKRNLTALVTVSRNRSFYQSWCQYERQKMSAKEARDIVSSLKIDSAQSVEELDGVLFFLSEWFSWRFGILFTTLDLHDGIVDLLGSVFPRTATSSSKLKTVS